MRWYAGYNLDEPLPDHSSLSKIRTRLGLPVFRRFFEAIVEQCARAGLVWGKELIFDATKVRANASMDSLKPVLRLVVDDHLAALATTECRRCLEEAMPRWELLEECRLDPDRPPTSNSTGARAISGVSPTDPDAALMKPQGERACLGYHDHYVVDGGKARIILHALVTPADVMENQPMLDQLRRVMFRWRVRPKRVIADTTYGTIDNIRALEGSGHPRLRAAARLGTPAALLRPGAVHLRRRAGYLSSARKERCCARAAGTHRRRRWNIGRRRRSATPAR